MCCSPVPAQRCKSLTEFLVKHRAHSLDICIDIQLYQGYSTTRLLLITSWFHLIHSITVFQDLYLVIQHLLASITLEKHVFSRMHIHTYIHTHKQASQMKKKKKKPLNVIQKSRFTRKKKRIQVKRKTRIKCTQFFKKKKQIC